MPPPRCPRQAAPYLGTLEPPLARELLRKLNSPAFLAAPALLAALARTDPVSGEPTGLIKVRRVREGGGRRGQGGRVRGSESGT